MADRTPQLSADLQRELEQVRAASTPVEVKQQTPVRKLIWKGVFRLVLLWALLILMYLGIWVFLAPSK